MTSIQWTEATWNPVTGCSKVSAGCKNCYAEGIADRFFAKQYPPNTDGSQRKFTDVRVHPERLEDPLRRKKPTMYFVNSMSDLFHEDVPLSFIEQILGVMWQAKQHTFQILTKRPKRMHDVMAIFTAEHVALSRFAGEWPLPNVWLGVSVENQKFANERIPLLMQTPAAVRFLSVEPLLEAVNLTELTCSDDDGRYLLNPLSGVAEVLDRNSMDIISDDPDNPRLDWVIVGGESGPGARPFNLGWADVLQTQCKGAGVAFFLKQIGSNPRLPTNFPFRTKDSKGGNPDEWPERLRVREWPKAKVAAA